MQIHEITYKKQLNEFTAGNMATFGKAMGNALMNKIAPGMNPNNVGETPAVQAGAKEQEKLWNGVVANLMQQTKTATGAQAVSIKDIPPEKLKAALEQQVNTNFLGKLTKNQVTDYQTLASKVDPADPAAKKKANDIVKRIAVSMDLILATEPTDANKAKTASAWTNLASNVFSAATMVAPETAPAATTAAAKPATATQRAEVDNAIKDLSDYVAQGGTITPQQRGAFVSLWKQIGGTEIRESKKKQ